MTEHTEIPDDMYKEHILELYKSPNNFGTLQNPTHQHTNYNSACGDEITIQMLVKDGIVNDIKFSGSGCVISMVSASLLTNKVKGMRTQEIKNLKAEDIFEMLNIKLNPARINCALVGLEAVRGALK